MKSLMFGFSTVLILLSGLAHAGRFEDAIIEYEEGNFVQAFKLLGSLAAEGNAKAQTNLGSMYRQGQGVAQDYKQAIDWYRKAASQGYEVAQHHLGLMYDQGQGMPQDFIHAHMWANLAAFKGGSNAVKLRDLVAEKMTQSQIDEAQKLAGECQSRNYKYCD